MFLGMLQISQNCETLQLKLLPYQDLSPVVVVGLFNRVQLLHQHISHVLSVNSRSRAYADVYGIRNLHVLPSPGVAVSQCQVAGSQAATTPASTNEARPIQDKTMTDSQGDFQVEQDSKIVPTQSPSKASHSRVRKSETLQLNSLTVDVIEVIAKDSLRRIEGDCQVKVVRDPLSSSPTEALLYVEGTSDDSDISRALERLKEECVRVTRQGVHESQITLTANLNVAEVKAMNWEEMRVIAVVEVGKCTIYGLRKDVEAAEKKVKKALQSPRLDSGSIETFTLQSGQTVIVKKGNIVHENVDVIVNAANDRLEHSGGVAGAICKAAGGPSFQDECRKLVRRKGQLREGTAVQTGAGSLPFKMVVHAVAPHWSWQTSEQSQRFTVLKKACWNSLMLTDQKGGTSVAIPGLGSGVYGIPKAVCAQALLEGTEEFFRNKRTSVIKRVVFIDLDDSTVAAFMAEAGKRYRRGASEKVTHPEKQELQHKEQGTGALAQITRAISWLVSGDSNKGDGNKGNAGSDERDELCSICYNQKVNKTLKCGHQYCKTCLDEWAKRKATCPTCNRPFGEVKGNQPLDAQMSVTVVQRPLPGYKKYGMIVINYHVPSGVQGPEHPNPGQRFYGTSRTAYLPNSTEGKELHRLLRKAFDARLVFTVGKSVTTGMDNMVTWNDIHHKTNIDGGPER